MKKKKEETVFGLCHLFSSPEPTPYLHIFDPVAIPCVQDRPPLEEFLVVKRGDSRSIHIWIISHPPARHRRRKGSFNARHKHSASRATAGMQGLPWRRLRERKREGGSGGGWVAVALRDDEGALGAGWFPGSMCVPPPSTGKESPGFSYPLSPLLGVVIQISKSVCPPRPVTPRPLAHRLSNLLFLALHPLPPATSHAGS